MGPESSQPAGAATKTRFIGNQAKRFLSNRHSHLLSHPMDSKLEKKGPQRQRDSIGGGKGFSRSSGETRAGNRDLGQGKMGEYANIMLETSGSAKGYGRRIHLTKAVLGGTGFFFYRVFLFVFFS